MHYWVEVNKSNRQARRMADRHYSFWNPNATKMANEVGPPGQKIILITPDETAVWGSHRPAPWAGITRSDGLTGMFCFLYRNEGQGRKSSLLIREAVGFTANRWGINDFWTYIGVNHIRSDIPGYSFFRARFHHHGWTESSKLGSLRRLHMRPHQVQRCLDEYLSDSYI